MDTIGIVSGSCRRGTMVKFRVLGPLAVADAQDKAVPLTAPMVRRLLAALLCRPNECVPFETLMQAVWGDDTPPSSRKTLLVYMRRLRLALADDGRIVCEPSGYRLRADPTELDATQFTQLVAAAGVAQQKPALELLTTALELWQGNAYEDVRDHPPIADEARRLDEDRLRAEARLASLSLELGEHANVVPRLVKLTAAHPYREDLRAHLMLAPYRCGRQVEALELFRDTRELLAEELAVEPGPALQQLHEAILRADTELAPAPATAVPIPRELPADIIDFAGRATEMGTLDQLAHTASPVIIVGSAGVGKTALAVHWAHAATQRYPHGQVYLNLRGFDPSGPPMTAADAIRRLLDTLGVAPPQVPVDVEAQASMYRSILADKRILLLLDNARDASQVRALIPGAGDSLAIITSRNQLVSLNVTNGARPLTLDVLSGIEARALLVARIGKARVTADPRSADMIIDRCARLPLALAIAAAHAAAQPHIPLAELAARLHETLSTIDHDDPLTDLHAVFSWSYQQLSAPAAQLFRLLGVHPGPDISTPAVASLANATASEVRPLLHELIRAHLLMEHVPGRYTFHDLLRAYAAELAGMDKENADAALSRAIDHCVYTAHNADQLIDPNRMPISLDPPPPGVTPEHLETADQAMVWFKAEHLVLIAVAQHANKRQIGRLSWALTTFLDRQGHWNDLAKTQAFVLRAAKNMADAGLEALAHRGIAAAHHRMDRFEEAQAHFQKALDIYRRLGDKSGQAQIHHNLAAVYAARGDHAEALKESRQALHLYTAIGDAGWEANGLNAVGWCHGQLGELEIALVYCTESLARLRDLGHHHPQAFTLDSLGYIYRGLGDYHNCVGTYQQSILLHRAAGSVMQEAITLISLGDAYETFGEDESMIAAWEQGLAIFKDLGHPKAAKIGSKIQQVSAARLASDVKWLERSGA